LHCPAIRKFGTDPTQLPLLQSAPVMHAAPAGEGQQLSAFAPWLMGPT
jgi:hypothetical protein